MSAPVVAGLATPHRGQWIEIVYKDGVNDVVRFVAAQRRRFDGGKSVWWEVDHGAYGLSRDDVFINEHSITTWTPADRPSLLLSYINSHGKRCFVGRYRASAQAEVAINPLRSFATDIRIEAAP